MGVVISDEKWLPVPGYEGLYEVSNYGRVKSLPRPKTRGRIKNQRITGGYLYVHLIKDGVQKQKSVHRLVLETFVPDHDPDKNQVDHIDADKTNNKLSNLEWVSRQENMERAYVKGLVQKKRVIDLDTMQIFESLADAVVSVGGQCSCLITMVCQGKRSSYHGHRFAYYDDYLAGVIKCDQVKRRRSSYSLWR